MKMKWIPIERHRRRSRMLTKRECESETVRDIYKADIFIVPAVDYYLSDILYSNMVFFFFFFFSNSFFFVCFFLLSLSLLLFFLGSHTRSHSLSCVHCDEASASTPHAIESKVINFSTYIHTHKKAYHENHKEPRKKVAKEKMFFPSSSYSFRLTLVYARFKRKNNSWNWPTG